MFKEKLTEIISFMDKLIGLFQWSRTIEDDSRRDIIVELLEKQKILIDLRDSGIL